MIPLTTVISPISVFLNLHNTVISYTLKTKVFMEQWTSLIRSQISIIQNLFPTRLVCLICIYNLQNIVWPQNDAHGASLCWSWRDSSMSCCSLSHIPALALVQILQLSEGNSSQWSWIATSEVGFFKFQLVSRTPDTFPNLVILYKSVSVDF